MPKLQNIVEPKIRQLRYKREMTQEMLAAKCSVLGLKMSRATLSKIEAQVRCVSDVELQVIARALKVEIGELFSNKRG